MIIYLVTFPNAHEQADNLTACGANNRLISYEYAKDLREGFLSDYAKRGHGRYIDEEAEKVKNMSARELLQYLREINKEE